jgi:peptidoglycan/xylan/chitin deacetylase (PgdA/CDA1 family)
MAWLTLAVLVNAAAGTSAAQFPRRLQEPSQVALYLPLIMEGIVVRSPPYTYGLPFLPVASVNDLDWAWNPPGRVVAPILLYHRVDNTGAPYSVSPERFEAQMQSLKRWGYTAVPLTRLVEALVHGTSLPPRPVAITFDDGYMSVYLNAFPVLQRSGWKATVFVVRNQTKTEGFMHVEQLRELRKAGWEIGSHSQTHADLRMGRNLQKEIAGSKAGLEKLFGSPVLVFAYPYGETSTPVTRLVRQAGYEAGVGLGSQWVHNEQSRYYLSRIEVPGTFTLNDFARLLPWSDKIGKDAAQP